MTAVERRHTGTVFLQVGLFDACRNYPLISRNHRTRMSFQFMHGMHIFNIINQNDNINPPQTHTHTQTRTGLLDLPINCS